MESWAVLGWAGLGWAVLGWADDLFSAAELFISSPRSCCSDAAAALTQGC